jgi:phosphoglycolate phosphatase-like HAD superfamily hydrolase
VSGVAAGRAGNFGLVVGVDRGAGRDALVTNGADLVVDDLAELVPDTEGEDSDE